MSESKMLNVPSRVVFVKEPPEDLSTEEMERKFSKFRGFVALRRFPNRAFVEFRSIEEASHFLHIMREEPITKNGPICRIYYDKDNGFDPTRAPSRKRKAGDSMDRERDPHWDRYYPDQPYDDRARYEDYHNRPSKYRRSEHDSAPRDRSPHDRSRDKSRERHREEEKKEERNDRQKERPDDDRDRERDHYDRAPREEHSPPRDREEQRRTRGDEHNGDYHRRDRREYMPREHVSREQHAASHERPRAERERSPERSNGARDREYQARDRPSGYYEERPRFIDPVHWERTVLPFFQDMGITSYNVERVPNYQASSTLYVNNLPPDATERELTNLFRFIPNFVQVRMIHKEGKNSFCFVDFRDPDSAYVARSLLQGYRMDSRSGIHIEYDKGRK